MRIRRTPDPQQEAHTCDFALRSFLVDPLLAPKLPRDIPSAVVAHRSADGSDTTHRRESSCAMLRAAEHGCVPSGGHPARPADAVQENLCDSALAAATCETARLFPVSAGAVCRSSTIESLGASTTATAWFDPTALAGSTTACRDPSARLLGRRSYKTLFPVAPAWAARRCRRWLPEGPRSGYDRRAPTEDRPAAAIL